MPAPKAADAWPPRPLGWAVLLDDGSAVLELGPPGVWRRWDELPLSRVRVVGIVRYPVGCPLVDADLVSGRFRVRGHDVALRVGGVEAGPFGPGTVRPLQFKSGHAEWRPDGRQTGTVVDAYHVGYETVTPAGRLRAVARLDAGSGRVALDVRAPSGVEILVDGRPIEDFASWEEATGRSTAGGGA